MLTSARFKSFESDHDALAHKVGVRGSEFRIDVPEMKSLLGLKGEPFFWSESDRINGYRKMQFLGSILSSLKQMIDHLASNSGIWR